MVGSRLERSFQTHALHAAVRLIYNFVHFKCNKLLVLSYRSQPSFGIVCGKMCQVKFFFLLSPPFVSPHGFNPVQVCSSDFSSPQEIKKISQIRQVANNLCRAAECQIFSSVPEAVGDLIDCDTICALD